MCEPIFKKSTYEVDCNQSVVTLGSNEEMQYAHYFSITCTEGIVKNLTILANGLVYKNEYMNIQGFYPDEPKRVTRWYCEGESSSGSPEEPLCYGDKVYLYTNDTKKKHWAYPRLISQQLAADETTPLPQPAAKPPLQQAAATKPLVPLQQQPAAVKWQISWNDGTLPPKVSKDNIIIKSVSGDSPDMVSTVTVYKKDIGWMVTGSILIALVIILLIVLIILSYYISRVWKIKLKDFVIYKNSY